MGESQIKVGDVVAWADVPIGALVVDKDRCYSNRQADGGRCVGYGESWESRAEMQAYDPSGPWPWDDLSNLVTCTIVAINLTGDESADELRTMARGLKRF